GAQQWGYFMRNKLELLDAPGEWYLDRAADQLYLWCPGNANPNNHLVEASVREFGMYVGWQRQHIKVEGIRFTHQHAAGLRLAGTSGIEAGHCDFSDVGQAIYSTGNNASFHHLDIQHTYLSGVYLIDNNTSFTHSTLRDIAMVPGHGEQNIGYCGIRMGGTGVVIADNRLETIGWSGIAVSSNALVERNVVIQSMALLNDGAGITFDNTDGAIIRNNIIRDMQGNLESCALNHYNSVPQCHGIYFGNISNKNVLVEGNTVMNCNGAGIHVDHTMVLSGVRVENNVLWNNQVQLSISDYSNYNGPGAAPPYYVPAFNTIYSGNVMYSLSKDQLCMRQYHVYGQQWVDFGTFSNNRYFSPYNDRSIYIRRDATGTHRTFTLERWQAEMNEDAGSTRSPLYLPSMDLVQVLAPSGIANGSFSANV
ncbi:MAG: right-handed parallel beta-helix repeat-containing protein, partial [Flavobacteriales bacterium]